MTELKRHVQEVSGRWVDPFVVQPYVVIRSIIIDCAVTLLSLLDTAELKDRVQELEDPRLKKR